MKPHIILPYTIAALGIGIAVWESQRNREVAVEAPPQPPPPPTSPLVVYSHRPWLLEGPSTNSLASFLFTSHEWETLCATLGPVAADGTLKLPQGSIRRLSPDSFTNLMESLGREAVRTGQVWISTGGGR